jgi:hypothetical protein
MLLSYEIALELSSYSLPLFAGGDYHLAGMGIRNAPRTLYRTISFALSLAILAAVLPTTASAQTDTGVYGPAAPENAGFVRVVNAAASAGEMELPVGPLDFGPIGFGEATPYRPLRAGISLLRSADDEAELIVRPDSYTTVLVTARGFVIAEDQRHDDPARAQLVLYNASSAGPVSLFVSPDGATVLEAVAPGSSKSRPVNAVTVDLAIRDGESVLGRPGTIRLTRGDSFGVFVLDGPDGPATRVHKATVVVEE